MVNTKFKGYSIDFMTEAPLKLKILQTRLVNTRYTSTLVTIYSNLTWPINKKDDFAKIIASQNENDYRGLTHIVFTTDLFTSLKVWKWPEHNIRVKKNFPESSPFPMGHVTL